MNNRVFKYCCFLLSVLLCAACFFVLETQEMRTCAGIEIMTDSAFSALTESDDLRLADYLLVCGHPVAMDTHTDTAYVPVSADIFEAPWRSCAKLSLDHDAFELFFAPDPAFDDLRSAISENHAFTLIAMRGDEYLAQRVVFTTLPLIEMDAVTKNDAEGSFRGSITLWDPQPLEQSSYSVAESQAGWHIRGRSSSIYEKAAYKITLLKDDSQENRNLNLLNLGPDDDWILSSMIFDDLKIREKVISRLWNTLQESKDSALLMSEGEYVEVIRNGRYAGVYLLKRRIDSKFPGGSHAQDVILKGDAPNTPPSLRYNPAGLDPSEIEALLSPYLAAMLGSAEGSNPLETVNLDNWLDLNAFVSAFYLPDNSQFNNLYTLIHRQGGRHILEFIPWDTDISFGMIWNGGVSHEPERVLTIDPLLRIESSVFFSFDPSLKSAITQRWQDLRSAVLSFENIKNTVEHHHEQLSQSGALMRDEARNSLFHDGTDQLPVLLDFIDRQLNKLDDYFESFPSL